MIENLQNEDVKEKIASETAGSPAVKKICDRVAASSRTYRVDLKASGLDISSLSQGRYRLKIWRPSDHELLAWFYRLSAIPHSRDRFSYGGIIWSLDEVDLANVESHVDEWLDWLDAGFNSQKRPANWTSAFSYDIPM